MKTLQKYQDRFNEVIYNTRERVYTILKITNTITLFVALGTLIYSLGFDLESDEITKVFVWLEVLIVIFILDYFIRFVYSLYKWEYIQEKVLESFLVVISLIIFIFSLLGIDIMYFIFLNLGFLDYRQFYESFISIYILVLTMIGLARVSQVISSVRIKPATTFIISFILLILIGTSLLMLPAMTTAQGGMSFLGALFISTSASCVTGLSTVTVASYFTFKGQLVILFLLQLGGIGIVSFATFFATFLSQGVGMKQQAIIQDVLSTENLSSARKTLQQVILLTFGIEAIGAIALFFSWGPDVTFYSPVSPTKDELVMIEYKDSTQQLSFERISFEEMQAEFSNTSEVLLEDSFNTNSDEQTLEVLSIAPIEDATSKEEVNPYMRINNSLANKVYYSIFHSMSAFCNAGFSLFPDGLAEKGVDTSYVAHIILGFIIIFGSLGFFTIQDVFSPSSMRERLGNPWKKWSMGTRIAVNMTIILVVLGAIAYLFLEQEKTLEGKTLYESLVISFFQSVTTRTAGFNTVSLAISDISQPTYVLFLFLMFIGASSGSTGGGIKTSTFLLLAASAGASIRGKKTVELGKRSIANDIINRAFSIVAFAITYNAIAIFLLLIVQPNVDIRELFFELISAFATVGLSTGITSSLNEYSQVILIVTMYVGRVGTLTLALALSKRALSNSYQYPSAHVMVG